MYLSVLRALGFVSALLASRLSNRVRCTCMPEHVVVLGLRFVLEGVGCRLFQGSSVAVRGGKQC